MGYSLYGKHSCSLLDGVTVECVYRYRYDIQIYVMQEFSNSLICETGGDDDD